VGDKASEPKREGEMGREEGPREAEEVVADAAGVEEQRRQRWLDTRPDSRTNLRPCLVLKNFEKSTR